MPCKYFRVEEDGVPIAVGCKRFNVIYYCIDKQGCINDFVRDYCIRCIHYEAGEDD